ncbi:SH3 domain-containing protein [Paenibacillus chondroitinus]|uniref:SH3 domain-containing protein n=1 Tax=Paenibacillus chondroitinus TaxID=59842 RepID=A0ABU6DFL0_9BACL|nr:MULTISPECIES: SH3 domain-containing C40 family peptidase [Paenibacillus]MCY9659127.1 C40 family peptidase [Paenibacillus anseongense]MEB4796538.1 SH3 domain-containing protein [Paenibacillus chondroitinus]
MKKWSLVVSLIVLALTFVLPAAISADVGASTKAQIVSGVSFRDQPSTSSNVIRLLKTNEIVTVTDYVTTNWYKVKDAQGVSGYVSTNSKYIKIVSNAAIIYGVNFRTLPSSDSSSKVIRMLNKGEEVLITDKVNDSWYKIVDANGTSGYVSTGSKYMVTDFSVIVPNMPLADEIEAVISAGNVYLGTPYEFGSVRNDPTTFDCSDFVQTMFWDALRFSVPSDSAAQGNFVRSLGPVSTDWTKLKRGDLMFFSSYKGSKPSDYVGVDPFKEPITHVGLYLGNGSILHTYSVESGGVRVDTIDGKQWENRFLYGGSVLR